MTGQLIVFPERRVEGELWEPYVDEAAVARRLGVTTRTVRRWRSLGMPSRLFGGARRFRMGEVLVWHAEREAS